MNRDELALSVILVVGNLRSRSQRSLDALCAQGAIDRMEIILIDIAPANVPALTFAPHAPVKYHRFPDIEGFADGRYEGLLLSTAPAIACIEDHAYAQPGWAEALIEAYKGPWAAVGYAFINANPETYLSRACFMNDYGPWAQPAKGGATNFLPQSNISYRREALMAFGGRLKTLFSLDYSTQNELRARGLTMCVEPRAVAAHENFRRLPQMIGATCAFTRLLAGHRVRIGHWSPAKRFIYGLLTPAGAPIIAVGRYARSFIPRPALWGAALQALPVFVFTRLLSGWSEAIGYVFEEGGAQAEVMDQWEMSEVRSTAD